MRKIYLVSIALVLATSVQAGLYRWVDDAGNVHFSDKVPAAASKKSHAQLNKSGDITKEVDPALKQKKIDEIAAKKREKEQQEEIRRIKAEAQAIIQKRDDDLLSTYENEQELSRYFESKMKMVEGNTNILKAQNKLLHKKISKLEIKAESANDEATLNNIAKKIVNISNTIEQYQKALDENDKQMASLTEDYQTNLARFIELTK